MSKRELEILAFITLYREKYKLSPSIREISEGVGLHSTSSVQKYLQSLMEKGYLQQTRGKMRSIVPVKPENAGAAESSSVRLPGSATAR